MVSLKILLTKALLAYGFLLLIGFLFFRVSLVNFSPYIVFFSILLLLAELHNVTQFFTMLYSFWPRKYKEYKSFLKKPDAQIHMFICVCGEPAEIVRETILAAKKSAAKYNAKLKPINKPKVIVLNDGFAAKRDNAEEIKKLCEELDVYHVARENSTGFKAGNLNNGFKNFPATDPNNTFDVVLDADFAVVPDFLLEITKPLNDNSVDFVQTPQRYKNENTWVAQAAAAHQIHFFKHVCPAKAYDNALFLCGTNFIIRRSALDSVGGMDERFITEDYATSLNLHLNGKKGVFIGKPLAYGVAPSTLKSYFSQQQRWSKGTFDTGFTYMKQIVFGNLTPRQRFQYIISSLYYLSGLRNFIYMLAPLPYLFFGVSLIKGSVFDFFTIIYGPLFLYNFIVYFKHFDYPLKSWVLDTISFPVFIAAFFSSVFKKNLAFIVTIKKYQKENIFQVYKLQLFVIVLLIAGLIESIRLNHVAYTLGEYINYFWVIFNAFVLSLGFYLFLKDNYVTDVDLGTKKFHVKATSFVSALEKGIVLPLIASFLLFAFYQIPEVKNKVNNFIYSASAETVAEYELIVPAKGVYYGYYFPELNSHPENPEIGIIENEKVSLTMYYQDWHNKDLFDVKLSNALDANKTIPVITWEPWSAKAAESGTIDQKDYTPRKIADGTYDAFIRDWARQAARYEKPYFLRFAHEMNGNWYPWGNINTNTPQDYKDMWIHVHKIFEEEGATNTIWVWSPNNTDEQGSSESILSYYPGDAYVDWVAYSGFNWGNSKTSKWSSFEEISSDVYPILEKLNKPIMVAETSTASQDTKKAEWFKQLVETLPSMPNIKAVVFYNDQFKNHDFQLSSGMDAASVITTTFVNNNYFIKDPLYRKKTASPEITAQ